MKTIYRLPIIVLCAIIILVATLFGIDALLNTTACENKVLSQIHSPDNRYIAENYERGCGATAGFNRQIKFSETKKPWGALKRGFKKALPSLYDTLYGLEGKVFTIAGQQPIQARWKDDNTLVISHPKSAKIYSQDKKWQTVTILYEMQEK